MESADGERVGGQAGRQTHGKRGRCTGGRTDRRTPSSCCCHHLSRGDGDGRGSSGGGSGVGRGVSVLQGENGKPRLALRRLVSRCRQQRTRVRLTCWTCNDDVISASGDNAGAGAAEVCSDSADERKSDGTRERRRMALGTGTKGSYHEGVLRSTAAMGPYCGQDTHT
jgi:hypothetical protein